MTAEFMFISQLTVLSICLMHLIYFYFAIPINFTFYCCKNANSIKLKNLT